MFKDHTIGMLDFAIKDIKQALHCAVDMESFFGILKYTAQLKLAKEELSRKEAKAA